MDFRAKYPIVSAEYHEELTELELHGLMVPVPAGHYVIRYPGGVGVMPREDFEMLYQPFAGRATYS